MSAAERLAEAESLLREVLAARQGIYRKNRMVGSTDLLPADLKKKVEEFLA